MDMSGPDDVAERLQAAGDFAVGCLVSLDQSVDLEEEAAALVVSDDRVHGQRVHDGGPFGQSAVPGVRRS